MDPFLGEIRLFPYSYVPKEWAVCDGSTLQINAAVVRAVCGTRRVPWNISGTEMIRGVKFVSIPSDGFPAGGS